MSSEVLALVAERDPALRQLTGSVLRQAGYDVRECSNALQLKAELYSSPVLATENALLVLSADIAAQCASELRMLERARAATPRHPPAYVFVCEFGALKQFTPPGVSEHEVAAVLEKPFDVDELERVALRCLARKAPGRAQEWKP
ncbi:MAG TPA: hypothetical protein VM686_03680 [Polyangiaceae bacterium]|nr:hypothetical protein [Polyangiaceae bacterium]